MPFQITYAQSAGHWPIKRFTRPVVVEPCFASPASKDGRPRGETRVTSLVRCVVGSCTATVSKTRMPPEESTRLWCTVPIARLVELATTNSDANGRESSRALATIPRILASIKMVGVRNKKKVCHEFMIKCHVVNGGFCMEHTILFI